LVPRMTNIASIDLISELETVVQRGSAHRRVQILHQITCLFLSVADRLNEQHIGVYDDIFVRLMECSGPEILARLSSAFADLASPPKQAIRNLAIHEDATVAAPVLLKSASISETDLIEVAGTRGQQHLLAIARRKTLSETLTDVLVLRGDTQVCRAVAKNDGARFSRRGLSKLIDTAARDDDVAESLVLRSDTTSETICGLVSNTTSAVHARLLKVASPGTRGTIEVAIESVAARAGAKKPEPIDYSEAKSTALSLNNAGKLNDSSVNRFAVRGEHTKLVAALSLLADVSIQTVEELVRESDLCGLVIACRASRLNWQTTLAVIRNRKGAQPVSQRDTEQYKEVFESLFLSTAQRTIRYGSVSDVVSSASLTGNAVAAAGAA
jgi:uncharacterized protein (DUF2336 family)